MKSEHPFFSIITVCFNSAGTIRRTIQSILEQSFEDYEYLVIDGGSTDGTLQIIQEYEPLFQGKMHWISEKDNGIYDAMNKGISMAQGEYVLLLNADDCYVDDAVEILVNAKEYSGCTIVSALAEYVDDDMNHVEFMRSMPMDDAVYLRMPLRHETMLIPASLYRQFGKYDTSYGIISDWKFTIEIFRQHISHYEVPKYLLKFRNTGTSCVQREKLIAERGEESCVWKIFLF